MCSPKKVRCFKCYGWFDKSKDKVKQCKTCGDFICAKCGACMCSLTKNEQKVVMAMLYTYENFLKEELKQETNYDFSKHKNTEESF